MKSLIKITTLSLVASSVIYAGGYKIPETSTNAVALSAANVAHSKSADAAYYNPANMVFMEDENNIEVDLMYIGLDATHFQGAGSQAGDSIDAKSETFLIPSVHYVSPKLGNARVGLSIVVPAGLTKRWSDSPAVDKAEEFSLQVVEINPTAAFEVTDKVAVAVGFRIIHSEGIVKSSSTASRDMSGSSLDYGYNLALSYKPTSALDIALTYRSNVELSQDGNAKLSIGNSKVYDGGASVSVPLPAAVNLAAAYTFGTKTTVEAVYEKTYWSAYSSLDFNYDSAIPNILQSSFDTPIAKDWQDTESYRLGLTQELDSMTLMLGMVYSQTPVPDERVSYELPDANTLSFSCGARYNISKKLDIGLSALYSMHENRSVKNDDIEGEFSNSNALLVSAGVGYKF